MKKLIHITIALLSLWSCAQFDDSKIWDEFKNYYDRLEKVEAACNLMNSNISALQAIVTALQGNDYVTGVAEIVEDGEVVGYTITFSKSGVVKIYHGKDGAAGADGAPGADGRPGADGAAGSDGVDGKDGHSPVVGVRKDVDGVYYWTIDGEWMLDDEGQKVPATGKDGEDPSAGSDGKDGVTPLLKIEDGYWFVSYDGGSNWTKLYKAVGENGADGATGAPGQDGADGKDGADGDSFFQGVDTTSSEDYIILTLADGTQIKLPTWKAFEELQTMVNKLNTNLSALQTIVEALQNNDYITDIQPIIDNGIEIGYTILFAKSPSITIFHGKDGADGSDGAAGAPGQDGEAGKDGYIPVLGVKAADDEWSLDNDWDGDSEGQTRYYWTLDGEWLLDENGNRIPASGTNGTDGSDGSAGQKGQTPKLKIVDGYWYISLDGGQTWQPEPLGPASAGAGGNIFTDISYDSAYLYITLSDGELITLSRSQENPSTLWSMELEEITHRSATFSGHLIVPEDALTHAIITIYYSESEDFNIFTAKSVSTTEFDYRHNFYLTIDGLKYNTDYYYCAVVKVRDTESYGKTEKFTTYVSGMEIVTKSYLNAGLIKIADGQLSYKTQAWMHSELIELDKLIDYEGGFCTSELQGGHTSVANIAYYSSSDFNTYISGITLQGQNKSYTAKEIKEAAPAKANYVAFTTYLNCGPLQITMLEDTCNVPEYTSHLIASENDFNIVGFVRPSGVIGDSDRYRRTDYIDIRGYNFKYIKAHTYPNSTSVSPIVFFDEEKNCIGGYILISHIEGDFMRTVPSNAAYVMSSSSFKESKEPLEIYGLNIKEN